MNNRIKFGSHVKLSVCLLALLVASESLGTKEGGAPTVGEDATAKSLKRRSFKDTFSILKNQQHAEHKAVKDSLANPKGFKDCTQDFALNDILKLAKEVPEYKAFTVMSLLGNFGKDHAKHASAMALEIFNDAGADEHHKAIKEALLIHFQTAPERVLPLEQVKTFMGKGDGLDFWGSMYLFKSDDKKKHDVGMEELKKILSDSGHPSHAQAHSVLNSSEKSQNLKKLSKCQQNELRTLLNEGVSGAIALPTSQHTGNAGDHSAAQTRSREAVQVFPPQDLEQINTQNPAEHQEIATRIGNNAFNRPEGPISFGLDRVAEDQLSVTSSAASSVTSSTTSEDEIQTPQKNQVDFSGLLEKIPDIKQNQKILVKHLENLPPDTQDALSQHLEGKDLTSGYELSQALGSFKNGESSLKNDLALEAWIANPQY